MSIDNPQNFTMFAGENKILKVTVVDEAGDPLPLIGTQLVTWRLARTQRSNAVLSKTLASGVSIITQDAALGEINAGRMDIQIESADSNALDGEYYHDCQIVDVGGVKSTIFYGRADVEPN